MPRQDTPAKILAQVGADISGCRDCARLSKWCGTFRDRPGYWARGVPGFGDSEAKLLVLGLAPGAHGANRTGRPFTGDGAGVFLYRALFDLGLSSSAEPTSRDDGLTLRSTWITNTVKCCPPANKPTPEETRACSGFLVREMKALDGIRAVLALGRTAHDAWLAHLINTGHSIRRLDFPFAHGSIHQFGSTTPVMVDTFHTSRYNVNTGRLTYPSFLAAIRCAAKASGALR